MRTPPVRTCVGCRTRATTSELLRVVLDPVEGKALVPDERGRMPGRGAHLHTTRECLELAERRRAWTRALRADGPIDASAVRRHVEQLVDGAAGDTASSAAPSSVSSPVASQRSAPTVLVETTPTNTGSGSSGS